MESLLELNSLRNVTGSFTNQAGKAEIDRDKLHKTARSALWLRRRLIIVKFQSEGGKRSQYPIHIQQRPNV
jgi:chromosome condensin MukBEF MukE localization factor